MLLSATSVFASPLAMDWLTLLRTLDQPRAGTIRRAALTCFVGWTFTDLAGAGEGQLDRLTAQIRRWRRLLARRGVAALVEAITNDTDLNERLLGRVGGERALTDLRHIGQSLHATMQSGQLGVNALVEWLAERIDDARSHGLDGSRRLDTEARSVAVLTVHASKGLQFPIVYLPEAWDTYTGDDEGEALLLHERGDGSPDDCLLDVGGLGGSGRRDRLARARWEESGEDLRLLYVGLTRAQCQVVTWWAPSARNTAGSALHRLLYRERAALPLDAVGLGDGIVFQPAASYPVDVDPLRLDLGPHIALEPCEPRSPTTWQRAAEPPGGLSARTFDRTLDVEWRRTSYSALTAAAHGVVTAAPAVGSEPEVGGRGRRADRHRPHRARPGPHGGRGAWTGPAVADGRSADGHRVRHGGACGLRGDRSRRRRPARRAPAGVGRRAVPDVVRAIRSRRERGSGRRRRS